MLTDNASNINTDHSGTHNESWSLLDSNDPLANLRDEFQIKDGMVYLDGNSLGALPKRVIKRVRETTEAQWGEDLIASWNTHHWIDLPVRVGNKIGALIGAKSGQTVCCDSISVNLFKALACALKHQHNKTEILTTKDNFPTDIYMAQGLQSLIGAERCKVTLSSEEDLVENITHNTAVVMFTQVNFRTGAILPVKRIVEKAKSMGALVVIDLAHSAGVLPIQLDTWGIDFAVGCTYKYLNGGPGAPGFIYMNEKHHNNADQPLYGWMGHANAFAFSPQYQGALGIEQMLVGTPPILSMSAVDAALDLYDSVTIDDIRNKTMALGEYFLKCLNASSTKLDLGEKLKCISPLKPNERGSQLSFEYEHAYGLCQALIERGVIADFRAPNVIRFGFAPLYNSFEDVYRAIEHIESVVSNGLHLHEKYNKRNKVT